MSAPLCRGLSMILAIVGFRSIRKEIALFTPLSLVAFTTVFYLTSLFLRK